MQLASCFFDSFDQNQFDLIRKGTEQSVIKDGRDTFCELKDPIAECVVEFVNSAGKCFFEEEMEVIPGVQEFVGAIFELACDQDVEVILEAIEQEMVEFKKTEIPKIQACSKTHLGEEIDKDNIAVFPLVLLFSSKSECSKVDEFLSCSMTVLDSSDNEVLKTFFEGFINVLREESDCQKAAPIPKRTTAIPRPTTVKGFTKVKKFTPKKVTTRKSTTPKGVPTAKKITVKKAKTARLTTPKTKALAKVTSGSGKLIASATQLLLIAMSSVFLLG